MAKSRLGSLRNKRFRGVFCTKKPISVFLGCARALSARSDSKNPQKEFETLALLQSHASRSELRSGERERKSMATSDDCRYIYTGVRVIEGKII